MANSSIKYTEPASGTEIATQTFTEDSTTKHFERFITGYKPAVQQIKNSIGIGCTSAGTPQISDFHTTATWTQSTAETNTYYTEYLDPSVNTIGFLTINGTSYDEETSESTFLSTPGSWHVGDLDSLGYDAFYVNTAGTAPASYYTTLVAGSIGFNVSAFNEFFIVPACMTVSETAVYHAALEFDITNRVPVILESNSVTFRSYDADVSNASYQGEACHFETKGAKSAVPFVVTMPASGVIIFYGIGI